MTTALRLLVDYIEWVQDSFEDEDGRAILILENALIHVPTIERYVHTEHISSDDELDLRETLADLAQPIPD